MKKFLEFIKELIMPLIGHIFTLIIAFLAFGWLLSFFGLFVFCAPSPLWLRWAVGVFDSFCLIMIIYGWIYTAWNKVYKQK
jgi:hypothetical protein